MDFIYPTALILSISITIILIKVSSRNDKLRNREKREVINAVRSKKVGQDRFIKVRKPSLGTSSRKTASQEETSELKNKLEMFVLRNQFYDMNNL